MRNLIVAVTGITVALLGLNGCSEHVDSDSVRTSGIYAEMKVNSSSTDSSSIVVYLKVGGRNSNTYVKLTNGDELTATLNSTISQPLLKGKSGSGQTYYSTTFTDATAGLTDSVYKISFNRTADESATNSIVTLPAVIANLSVDKQTFSRSTDALTITWSSVDNTKQLNLHISGDCIANTIAPLSVVDNGSYVINPGTLTQISGSNTNCAVSFTFYRSNNGSIDPAFGKGGEIYATTSSTVLANSIP